MNGSWLADEKMIGQRLDRTLCVLLPGLGLRSAKRLISSAQAKVNGKSCLPSRKIVLYDRIDVNVGDIAAAPAGILLKIEAGYAFLYKPPGLHSAVIRGHPHDSLERQLSFLLPEFPGARLLQRLDLDTSGIVCAALDAVAEKSFRELERKGQCEKRYAAVLSGKLERCHVVENLLDCAHRRKTRLLGRKDSSGLRHTEFLPFGLIDDGFSLAGCRIRLGARHQIRAHAAALGMPLVGDCLYGGAPGTFRLHHGAIFMPGASCVLMPDWPEEMRTMLDGWFKAF